MHSNTNIPSAGAKIVLRAKNAERALCGIFALCIACVLIIAARLTPSPDGFGTHRQLGLRDCAWAMWFKKPCMTCGMTTSFAHAAHGDFASSIRAQPAGFVLCMLSASMFWVCLHTALTGSKLASSCLARVKSSTIVVLLVILALGWMYKYLTWPTT